MMHTGQIAELFAQYGKLTEYCDTFFSRINTKYPQQLACRVGCHSCCELESVCALEGAVLYSALDRPIRPRRTGAACVLLFRGRCRLYFQRPIICRTHGLAIIDTAQNPPKANCCPLNFTTPPVESLSDEDLFDEQRIATNLMRLNLAFCTLIGAPELSGQRFYICDAATGNLPTSLLKAGSQESPFKGK